MNIQDLKSNTTWQEASNTINNNNNKISLAIATLENATLKNRGYFTSVEKLKEAVPNPTIGSKAYVGTSEPYAIYIVENGVWVDSGYTGGDEIVAKITTARIEDGAVTSEKIATSAFDDTLSTSRKLADAKIVGDKFTEQESKLADLEDGLSGKQEIDLIISQDNKNINQYGKLFDIDGYGISQEIELKKGAVIRFTSYNSPTRAVLASDTNITIQGVTYKVLLNGDNAIREYEYISTIDQKVVICGYKQNMGNQIIVTYSKFDDIDGRISENKESIDKNTEAISSLNSEIGSVIRATESAIIPAKESYYYISKTGIKTRIDSNSFNITEPISVKKGEILSAIFGSKNTVASFSKYNSDGTYTALDSDINDLSATTHTIEANEDCEIVISFYRVNGLNDVKVIKASTIDDLKKRTDKIESDFADIKETQNDYLKYAVCRPLFIGGSLTEGALPTSSWGDKGVAIMKENFPYMFGRMTGAVIKNEGHSGYSASNWWLDFVSTTGSYVDIHDSKVMPCRITDKPAFDEYDTIFIWLGTNYGYTDTLDTDVNPYTDYNDFANTETGFLCKIIEKIKEATHGESLIVLSKIFVTKSDGLNPTTSNIVIEKIAQKYGCLLVDNSDLSYAKHPELHMNINNPHFGKAGNLFLANRYIKELYSYFSEDVLRCEFGIS